LIDVNAILNSAGSDYIKKVRANMSREDFNASGKTSKSLRQEVEVRGDKGTLTIYSGPATLYSETGRGPYKGGPNGNLKDKILDWMPFRGIGQNLTTSKERERLASFIAYRINLLGTKLWQRGKGRKMRNIYSDESEELIEDLKKKINVYVTSITKA
jgi:hypothetical protein